MLCVAGLLFLGGILSYDGLHFLGIRQLLNPADSEAVQPFRVTGIHRWMRHPWYSSAFLLLWRARLDGSQYHNCFLY